MFVGHFAVSLIGKRLEPKISLGTLLLAAMLPDFVSFVLMIAGVEGVRFKPGVVVTPGMRAIDALEVSQFIYSHSLLMGAIWGGLLAAFYFARRGNKRGAWILFAAVLSHWFLDFASHPPDMALAPGLAARFGLGLWNSIAATLIIEGAFWVFAIVIYLQVAHARSWASRLVFWIPAVILTLAWYGNIAGPPPSDPSIIGYTSLTFFSLTVAWAYWCNRLRPAVQNVR